MTIVVQKSKHKFHVHIFSRKSCLLAITWQNSVEPGRPQMVICRMCIACWVLTLQTQRQNV